ncbi:MAG TPA: cytochrome c, partial [Magnetospirillaceae bacterium]|nr:cytochrome c [Magnetospirillaceae bacterium]
MRWLVRILAVLVALVVVAAAAIYLLSSHMLNRTYDVPTQALALTVPSDAASIARGRHFAFAIAKCTDCHGAHLGGTVFLDVPPFRLIAPNLTKGRGGLGASLADADFVRAIRYGVAPDGTGLLVMPASGYQYLSDADLADLIAYVKSVPPADSTLPATDIRPLGRLLAVIGALPQPDAATIDFSAPHQPAMPPSVTATYGLYIAKVGGCTGCHRANLAGGPIPGLPPDAPPAQNLTPAAIGSWTQADFTHALRTGKRPDGTTINTLMPWPFTAQMTDAEIDAVWLYLRSVPSVPS